eukprot:CAMPEP_0198139588 /NCGR_PEP_ID=MMETSP1443-20131203/2877_1 /TAXON_ID=186043 /ORGANISM="Entomoneis sp., Strain CCMP2396" /LENGTH=33 /DNA_ID= /DNA_START= /DNA_END= /DNA_ORIENTATION=
MEPNRAATTEAAAAEPSAPATSAGASVDEKARY